MKTYFAIFNQLENGDWGVRFPDAPSIHTSGKDLDEALEMGVDALSGILVVGRKGREYSAPSSFAEVKGEAKSNDLVFPVVPIREIMEEYKPKKRINVMVATGLLDRVNAVVKETSGIDRSQLFCRAAEKYLAEFSGF